jgi:hypothetical protein
MLSGGVPVIHLLNIERLHSTLAAAARPPGQMAGLLRRLLAGLGILFTAWWVFTRLRPPALGPLPVLVTRANDSTSRRINSH